MLSAVAMWAFIVGMTALFGWIGWMVWQDVVLEREIRKRQETTTVRVGVRIDENGFLRAEVLEPAQASF